MSPRAIVASPDGRHVYVAQDFADFITVINTESASVTRTIPLGSPAWAMAVSPDGATLYASQGATRTLLTIDVQTGVVKARMPTGPDPVSVTMSRDGTTLYVIDSPCPGDPCDEPATVLVIDTRSNTVTRELMIGATGRSAALSPDGTRLYAADLNDIWIFSTANYELLGKIRTHSTTSLAISSDGLVLYATRHHKPTLISMDTARFTIFDKRPLPTRPNDAALSPDGKTLYALSQISGPTANPDPGVVTAMNAPALVNIQATCARVGSKKAPAVRCMGITIGVPEGAKLGITYRNPPSMEWKTIPESMTPIVSADGRFTWTMATGKTRRITLYFSYEGTKSPLSAVKLL
jgi:YVTN family beta-propeller protein